MSEQQTVPERKGREGGRWVNERPSPQEFSEWFTASMKLDPALKHEDYIGGVVLIPAVDAKAKYVASFRDGRPVIEERPELNFVPYAKVETRTNYFWDLLAAHEEWVGVVERITPPRMPIDFVTTEERVESGENHLRTDRKIRQPGALALMVHQLPEGFSIMSVPVGEGYSHYLCCTTKVAIYDRTDREAHGTNAIPLRKGQATKQVPLLKSFQQRVWADDSSLMKAETGALGRALGFAGIFVIPGSGVATAEDMMEAMAETLTPTSGEPSTVAKPAVPGDKPARTGAEQTADEEVELQERAVALYNQLKEQSEKAREFDEWATNRKIGTLRGTKGAMLRGVVKKLERMLDASEEGSDVPSEAAEAGPADQRSEEESDAEPSGSTD